jgi:tartrate dehydrogenase/decarboxylase/D-malate dehydrogenase
MPTRWADWPLTRTNCPPSGPGPHVSVTVEPLHGSAPDIAGQDIANPIGQVWAAAMMLEHLGQPRAAQGIVAAIEAVLSESRLRTRDLGGSATTLECGKALAQGVA